jgi:hypothetical protein
MKQHYKLALLLFLFASAFLLSALFFFYQQKSKQLVTVDSAAMVIHAQEVAADLDHYLKERIKTVESFSVADVILNELRSNNRTYAELGELNRKERIELLNAKWVAALDEKDPFVKSYLTNAVAKYLARVAATSPDEFGEIFITNRYGAMIATTNKLTTLAHAHKYWWKAAYNDGKGRVFLDDRGFDQSVAGYVIGVVVPIKEAGKVIGILKANFNVMGGLSRVLWSGPLQNSSEINVVRSGGLVVLKKNGKPLSESMPTEVIEGVDPLTAQAREVVVTGGPSPEAGRYLIAHAPVSLSLGAEDIAFGGKYRSIDQYKGNEGESWMVMAKKDLAAVVEPFGGELMWLLWSGAALLLFFVLLAAWVGGRVLPSE